MNSSGSTTKALFQGSAGLIEALVDVPADQPFSGVCIVTHPHPLQGGTAEHKIPHTLAQCFRTHGWLAVRPNFRGVGTTEGTHDAGVGETDDVLRVIQAIQQQHPGTPIALAGFSFGAYVQARVASRLMERDVVPTLTILAGTPFGTIQDERLYDTPIVPNDTLVIHGEADTVVPLDNVLQWARPQRVPVVVVPGANHFFTGYLSTFLKVVGQHIMTQRRMNHQGAVSTNPDN